ncbi:molybdopterin-dependent oxidoreductase [Rhizobium sp. DKSPLA3]|uniref:Molybdopterin-dependent oxidoreductase n=1 Tax=Rhizobium quercicola TaxID=2901226 RepID=A0A9X1NRC0_9HYPH|nr:molybdopterin cofactor-binding domain-containing protein [Rhizobium quercicola]MCD7109552.1 molybdopterin-dependent oxidoreductase [Rhizobium quercicola]
MAALSFDVLHPASVREARDLLQGDARLVAGGTALQLDWARGLPRPSRLIDLGRIPGLKGITDDAAGLRIGALTPLARLVASARVAQHLPLLQAAARSVAGPAVRNLATLGGNIAGRTGCLLPALLALDAVLEMTGRDGRCLEALSDWLARPADPMEVLEAVHLPVPVPVPDPQSRWTQRKIGLRAAFTPSVIGIAGRLECRDGTIVLARLAVGGGLVVPCRLSAIERQLVGQDVAGVDWPALRTALIAAIDAPDDAFRSARYRRMVAANALVRGLQEAGGSRPAAPPPGRSSPAETPATPPEIRLSRTEQASRWHVRPDMAPKVSGTLSYLTDRREAGMLVGRILRAGRPHARILSIDTRAAAALPGVAAVVTHRDIGGENAFGIVVQDQPAFCFDRVRHAGDPVAAVAAVDAATAEAALALIRVDYEDLPIVTDPEQALSDTAPAIHAGGNLQRILHFSRGDVAAGFAGAAHAVERRYETARQMHGFLETEGGFARVEPDGTLAVFVGGQHGARDRLQLARILGRGEDTIRVVTSPTGGAFGGKDELTVQPALALLAITSGRPVRLQLSRAESVVAGIKRHPMVIRMRTACDAAGRLIAQEVDLIADAGAYASLGPGVLETALEHVAGPYVIPHVSTRGRLAYTNNGVCGAFRGFGANQMTYAIECQMDVLADLCGLTPVAIRRRNLRAPASPGFLGQTVAPSERLSDMLEAAAASPLWDGLGRGDDGGGDDGEEMIGTGMALNYQGNGLGSLVPDPAGGRLRLRADGRIEAAYGLDEMGQGLLASIQAAVSDELGCGRGDILPVTGDTALAPDSGSTSASRGGHVVWRAARLAGPDFSARLRQAAAGLLGRPADGLKLAPGGVADRRSNSGRLLLRFRDLAEALAPDARPCVTVAFDFPKTDHTAGNARYIFAFGACIVRVAVSRVTGMVRVLDIHQHTAAGPVLDVAAYLGQMEGGAIQGLGFTLTENARMADGAYLTANLDTYMLPGIRDTARRLSVFALEGLDDGDGLGPRGAGELGIGAITPAIANAVGRAIGHTPLSLPFCPETLLDAIGARP